MMNKEDLKATTFYNGGYPKDYVSLQDLEEFFDSNICIPRGENRHRDADVLHTYVEDVTQTLEYLNVCNQWETFIALSARGLRIKPQEPVYEYKVRMVYSDGTYELTEKYFTEEEYKAFGFPKACIIKHSTKRERK